MGYAYTLGQTVYRFADLKDLLAKATPLRSGDVLAGIAAATAEERMAARMALADLPLKRFLDEAVVPYEEDEVTRLIVDTHDAGAFAPVAHLTVGDFRNWLLADTTDAGRARRRGARADAGDGGGGVQADAQPGPDPRRAQVPRRDALPQHDRPARAASPCASSPTIPPTTRAASPPPSSTACSTAAATP